MGHVGVEREFVAIPTIISLLFLLAHGFRILLGFSKRVVDGLQASAVHMDIGPHLRGRLYTDLVGVYGAPHNTMTRLVGPWPINIGMFIFFFVTFFC
jgi:hypothetical protein